MLRSERDRAVIIGKVHHDPLGMHQLIEYDAAVGGKSPLDITLGVAVFNAYM